MKSGCYGTLKSGKLGLSCSDAGIGDLGVLHTHESLVMEMTVYVSLGKPSPVGQAGGTNTSEEGRSPCSILEHPACNAGTPNVQGEHFLSIGGLDT